MLLVVGVPLKLIISFHLVKGERMRLIIAALCVRVIIASARQERAVDLGMLVGFIMNRYIVAGCPCAGKSTYVREVSKPGDLVYDYDTLHQALSGQPAHHHLVDIRPYVLAARDEIFRQLEVHKQQSAWLITSAYKVDELERLSKRFEAEIIFLEVGSEEAHRRAVADNRPVEWHDYIDDWFNNSDVTGKKIYKTDTERLKILIKCVGIEIDFIANRTNSRKILSGGASKSLN